MTTDPKIVLTGCGNILPTSVYSLLNGPMDVEVVLIGDGAPGLFEAVNSLVEETPIRANSTLRLGQESELAGAAICVVSSGRGPVPDESTDEFIFRNVDIVIEIGKLLQAFRFPGVAIVTTFPSEIMAHAVLDASGLEPHSVIGISPSVLTSFPGDRFRSQPLATWCSAAGCTVEYLDSCHPDCPFFEDMLERFHRYQRSIDHDRPATMASCVMRVCEAVLSDEKSVLPVAGMLNGEHAIAGTFATIPCVIGRSGIERVLELPLTEPEKQNLFDRSKEIERLYFRATKRASAVSGSRST
jgi:L-lactate dehydrogenase